MGPHYSQSSRDNATPSSGTSPLASYKEVPPRPGLGRSAILCKDYGTGDWKQPLRQRLTYDTFWRTFYAVLTTRSRIRNDEL